MSSTDLSYSEGRGDDLPTLKIEGQAEESGMNEDNWIQKNAVKSATAQSTLLLESRGFGDVNTSFNQVSKYLLSSM